MVAVQKKGSAPQGRPLILGQQVWLDIQHDIRPTFSRQQWRFRRGVSRLAYRMPIISS